jgi:hypothetical protein
MKIVYESMMSYLTRVIDQAKRDDRHIERIVLTDAEWASLRGELIQQDMMPPIGSIPTFMGVHLVSESYEKSSRK